jgi:GTP-dependent dephospho-CoA kinase
LIFITWKSRQKAKKQKGNYFKILIKGENLKIDQSHLGLLKEPFGKLIKNDTINKESLNREFGRAHKIITIGDTTTEKLVLLGYIPDISVVDGKEKRIKKPKIFEYPTDKILHFENKPGELDENVITQIIQLTQGKLESKIKFLIEGEEDLIALPFLMHSPDNWVICYGQPYDGLVIVRVNEESRKRAELIFNKVFNI